MPIYVFECPECPNMAEEFMSIRDFLHPPNCPDCKILMERSFRSEGAGNHLDREFHTPIEMYSIAMEDPEEIAEFQKQCPDVDVSLDPKDPMYGVPIGRTRNQKLKALKVAGFVER